MGLADRRGRPGRPRSPPARAGRRASSINLYGGASGTGFDKIIADCNQQAAGRYTIVGNLLPSDADGQREQFVRRLAAHDSGMDLLGMDVTWTAEFAEAGWIRELTRQQKAQATKDTLGPPIDDRDLEGQALRHPAHDERPAAVVPQVPGARPRRRRSTR